MYMDEDSCIEKCQPLNTDGTSRREKTRKRNWWKMKCECWVSWKRWQRSEIIGKYMINWETPSLLNKNKILKGTLPKSMLLHPKNPPPIYNTSSQHPSLHPSHNSFSCCNYENGIAPTPFSYYSTRNHFLFLTRPQYHPLSPDVFHWTFQSPPLLL